jgi:hypothetical protein
MGSARRNAHRQENPGVKRVINDLEIIFGGE